MLLPVSGCLRGVPCWDEFVGVRRGGGRAGSAHAPAHPAPRNRPARPVSWLAAGGGGVPPPALQNNEMFNSIAVLLLLPSTSIHSWQVLGRRRVLLLPPEAAFNGLYPYPLPHPYDTYSMVDFEAPNTFLWPMFDQVGCRQ
jgi:hypothetical protein